MSEWACFLSFVFEFKNRQITILILNLPILSFKNFDFIFQQRCFQVSSPTMKFELFKISKAILKCPKLLIVQTAIFEPMIDSINLTLDGCMNHATENCELTTPKNYTVLLSENRGRSLLFEMFKELKLEDFPDTKQAVETIFETDENNVRCGNFI